MWAFPDYDRRSPVADMRSTNRIGALSEDGLIPSPIALMIQYHGIRSEQRSRNFLAAVRYSLANTIYRCFNNSSDFGQRIQNICKIGVVKMSFHVAIVGAGLAVWRMPP
jgi:hypothetical protein